uniref:Shedu anti-phage system protein SduA domain-containing protein n=1 Tax=Microcystis aeruginosa TaxID=1126 RepID=UPI000A9E743B
EAIGQVVNYLSELELHQLEIKRNLDRSYCKEHNIDIFSIKPRAYIVIGNKKDWDEFKTEALRKLNYSLHGIEVLTYSDLQTRGQNIINLYGDDEDNN